VACPRGRLVFTACPLLSTPILSDPFGGTERVVLGCAHLAEGRDDLHRAPVSQLLTPFTKGRPRNRFSVD